MLDVFQNLSYEYYVIEQMDGQPINKGMLFNIGVLEGVLKLEKERERVCDLTDMQYCLVLHDIDLIPVRTTYN